MLHAPHPYTGWRCCHLCKWVGWICYLLGDRSCEQEVAILTVLLGATGFIKVGACTRFSSRPTRVYGSIGVGHEPGFSAVLLETIGFAEVGA